MPLPTLDVIVRGTPVSLQASPRSRDLWKARVRDEACRAIPEDEQLSFYNHPNVRVWIVYFHIGEMQGDIDNIAKPILDACNGPLWTDDRQIAHLTLRRVRRDQHLSGMLEDPPEQVVSTLARLAHEDEFVFIRACPYDTESTLP